MEKQTTQQLNGLQIHDKGEKFFETHDFSNSEGYYITGMWASEKNEIFAQLRSGYDILSDVNITYAIFNTVLNKKN